MTKNISMGLMKDAKPWKNVGEYFEISDTPNDRKPSPIKINAMIDAYHK